MIKMDALKKLCNEMGFVNVQTYIQSGNIIFQNKKADTGNLSNILKAAIEKTFGFDVPVITLTKEELQKIIDNNPFVKDKTKQDSFFHITFLSDKPQKENFEIIKSGDYKNDKIELIEKSIYLYCHDGYSNSKLTNSFLENKLKVTATTRNWKTANELLNIANKTSR